MFVFRFLTFLLLININNITAIAQENSYFKMLKNNKVNVRYGPSFDYPIKYFYQKKFLPVKIIDKKENWRKIIDHKKNSGWIHDSQLKKSRSFILKNDQILFSKPNLYSTPIARIERGKLILFKQCKKQWCETKIGKFHGWIELKDMWGKVTYNK